MFAREDCRDLQEGEEKKVPEESWDHRVEVESKELWDHRAYEEKKELKEILGRQVSQVLKVNPENLFQHQKWQFPRLHKLLSTKATLLLCFALLLEIQSLMYLGQG